jgi:hypothetical protein
MRDVWCQELEGAQHGDAAVRAIGHKKKISMV